MKINIPKILKAIPLEEYAPELEGQALQVWVNPTREMINRYNEMITEVHGNPSPETNNKVKAWYAEMLSQGPEDTRWTVEELTELESKDMTFITWLMSSVLTAWTEHKTYKKK
jgi:hypothetical protein